MPEKFDFVGAEYGRLFDDFNCVAPTDRVKLMGEDIRVSSTIYTDLVGNGSQHLSAFTSSDLEIHLNSLEHDHARRDLLQGLGAFTVEILLDLFE